MRRFSLATVLGGLLLLGAGGSLAASNTPKAHRSVAQRKAVASKPTKVDVKLDNLYVASEIGQVFTVDLGRPGQPSSAGENASLGSVQVYQLGDDEIEPPATTAAPQPDPAGTVDATNPPDDDEEAEPAEEMDAAPDASEADAAPEAAEPIDPVDAANAPTAEAAEDPDEATAPEADDSAEKPAAEPAAAPQAAPQAAPAPAQTDPNAAPPPAAKGSPKTPPPAAAHQASPPPPPPIR